MWKTLFDIFYILTYLVPNRARREYLRTEKLFDYKSKLAALRRARPDLEFKSVKMVKGGYSIGFVIDRAHIFKIGKFHGSVENDMKIIREKRLTDAFAELLPIRIPKITIIKVGAYTFFGYDFIPGKNLNNMPLDRIIKYRAKLAGQIAEFIHALHAADPVAVQDLKITTGCATRSPTGEGWNHNDLCNNMIVNPKTMDIVAVIDWEYANWDILETEFTNLDRFSSKMRKSGIRTAAMAKYLGRHLSARGQ